MVGLPDLVRPVGSATENEFVPVSIRGRTFEGEGYQGRIERLDDLAHCGVAGRVKALLPCFRNSQAVQSGKTRSGLRQGKSFDDRHSFGVGVPLACIGASIPVQRLEATSLLKLVPALKRPGTDPRFPGENGEWNLVLDVKSEDLPAFIAVHRAPTCRYSYGRSGPADAGTR